MGLTTTRPDPGYGSASASEFAWFGGAAFSLDNASLAFSGLPAEADVSGTPLPTVARIYCGLRGRFEGRLSRSSAVRWRWCGDTASTYRTPLRATVERRAPGVYSASGPDAAHAADLLTYLLWPALLREGGLVLHACVAELAGGAVAFVGPSGAGKTTAASLISGSLLFARDVAAVFPAEGRFWVAPLPGGAPAPANSRPSTERCLPLRGLARVRQSSREPGVIPLEGGDALAAVLAATRHGSVTPQDHGRLMDAALGVSRVVSVATVETVLGRNLSPYIEEWLEQP